MFFQVYKGPFDVNLLIFSYFFYIVNIILLISIICYILYRLYIKKEMEQYKMQKSNTINLITWVIFFSIICISNILKCVSLSLTINGDTSAEPIINTLFRIRIIIIYIAFLAKIIHLEGVLKSLGKYKGKFFSIIISIIIVILIFIDPNMLTEIGPLQIVFLILILVGSSLLPILYFYLAIKMVGSSRNTALKITIGSVFLGLGFLFRPENLEGYIGIIVSLDQLIGYTYITAPISMIIATILFFDSIRKKKKE